MDDTINDAILNYYQLKQSYEEKYNIKKKK